MRKPMLQKMALIIMGLILIWLIYFVVAHIGRLFQMRFGDYGMLPLLYGLDANTVIPNGSRNIIFIIWAVTYAFGVAATLFSLQALNEVRLGRLFTMSVTVSLLRLGLCLMIAICVGVTAYNIEQSIMLAYHENITYSPRLLSPLSELPLMLCGASFTFIGMVATEACRLQIENEEIV